MVNGKVMAKIENAKGHEEGGLDTSAYSRATNNLAT